MAFSSLRNARPTSRPGRPPESCTTAGIDGEARTEHDSSLRAAPLQRVQEQERVLHRAVPHPGRRPARSRRAVDLATGRTCWSSAAPRVPASASTRAAAAHGRDLDRHRSSSGGTRPRSSRAPPQLVGGATNRLGPVRTVDARFDAIARRARELESGGFGQRGCRRTRRRARPAVRRAPPASVAATAAGTPRRRRTRRDATRNAAAVASATFDARGCIIGLHSTPLDDAGELGIAAEVRTEMQRRGHRRVVHRDSCPRRAAGARRAPRLGRGRRRR